MTSHLHPNLHLPLSLFRLFSFFRPCPKYLFYGNIPSVVITTYNEEHNIRWCLESIQGVDDEILANQYMKEGLLSPKLLEDANHIAIASVYTVNTVVSWNFKHIVNVGRIRLFNSVNLKYGYGLMDIRSPREIIGKWIWKAINLRRYNLCVASVRSWVDYMLSTPHCIICKWRRFKQSMV